MSKKTTAVATTQTKLPAAAPDFISGSGRGVSSDQADNLVPLIYILQPMSPQVDKRDPKFVEGAEPGSIWLRNVDNPIVDPEKGILFQPCYFDKEWVEWIPRDSGGGFVGRHKTLPDEAEAVKDPKNPNKVRYLMPNGNELVETRYHIGLVHGHGPTPLPFVIPLTSTGHSFSRQWMFTMNQKRVAGGIADSYACIYRLVTKQRSNAQGKWFAWELGDSGNWVPNVETLQLGEALFEAFASGAKQADVPEHHEGEEVEDSSGM